MRTIKKPPVEGPRAQAFDICCHIMPLSPFCQAFWSISFIILIKSLFFRRYTVEGARYVY
jgi:hypothetical protein